MSTDADVILAALSYDTPMTRHDIEEATGLELKTISNRLHALKSKGLIAPNTEGPGWLLAGGDTASSSKVQKIIPAPPPPARVDPSIDKPAPRVAPPTAKTIAAPDAAVRSVEFAIGESGAILFKVTSGPRAGELGEIPPVDAMALYRLMSAVEFITENA